MMPIYRKPTLTQKKIALTFFLSNVSWLNQFDLTGDVYAQSGGSGTDNGGDSGENCGTCGDGSCENGSGGSSGGGGDGGGCGSGCG